MWKWIKGMPPMSKAALAAGVGALCAAAAMNIVFGQTLAATDRGQIIYSVASFVCAVAGTVVFGMMLGRLLRERKWAAAIVPALLLCLATVWDIVSVMGFNATERLSAVAYRQEAIAMAKDEQAMRKKYAEKLMGVATIRGNGISRTERKEFMATASAEIGKVGSTTAGPKLLPDALAELMSRYSGRSVEDIQLTLIVYMSILLILIQSAGFTYTTYFDDRTPQAEPRTTDKPNDGSGGSGGSEPKKFSMVQGGRTSEPAPVRAAEPANVSSARSGVTSTDAPKGKLTFEQAKELARANPNLSTRALAAAAKLSQTTAVRVKKRVREQMNQPIWQRGIGGGQQTSARI